MVGIELTDTLWDKLSGEEWNPLCPFEFLDLKKLRMQVHNLLRSHFQFCFNFQMSYRR